MSKRVVVVISEDPCLTHRPVEALRIALGFCAGDHETTVVLLGKAPLLLAENIDDIVDVDILEKYLPTVKQLEVPFVLEWGSMKESFSPGFRVTEHIPSDIRQFIGSVDRTVVF
jgi:hypothetical protein